VAKKRLSEQAAELKTLLIAYFKQEAVDPLKALMRFVAFGVAGSFLLGLGVVFLTLAGLRAIQTETDGRLDGNWSWAPYGIMVVVLLVGAVLVWRLRRDRDDVARGTQEVGR
jgi:Putative Actinobacterial Holin-X, holin superfamily III